MDKETSTPPPRFFSSLSPDDLFAARTKLAALSAALHAMACSAEEDTVLSKDAAFGLWQLAAEAEAALRK